jgi:hypothetical protein
MTNLNNVPIVNAPFIYINGLQLSNDATTPNTLLDIAVGQCRDAGNEYDMFLNSPLVINMAGSGLNGLDTGTVAASKVYAVLLVSDPVSGNPTGAMFTLTPSAPLMPFGYSAYKTIGYVATDSSMHILKGYWTAGGTGDRLFTFDAPQATAVTAGAATTYTAVDLSALVPNGIAELPVNLSFAFTPGAPSRTLKLQGANSTGDAVTITGQVTSVVVSGLAGVLAQIASSKPEVNYKVSNAGDAVALNVAGYRLSI